MMLSPGQIVSGNYRVERLLGKGGMAEVYLVTNTRLQSKKLALKLIQQEHAAQPSFVQRFRREAEILASLQHPHIVNVTDWNETETGLPYLVMEYLEGEDLSMFLARSGPLQPRIALPICGQVGEALEAAHRAGVVHRDLKPANIFLTRQGLYPNFVKVLDFGIAKLLQTAGPMTTAATSLIGTPAYMSPEQAQGQVERVDHHSDQFALAAILYEMLTGRPAFMSSPDEQTVTVLSRVIHHHPPPLGLPQVDAALARALRKEPAERFPSIHEFVSALGVSAWPAVVPPTVSTQGEVLVSRWQSKRNMSALAAGLLIVAGTGVWAWSSFRSQPAEAPAASHMPASSPAAPPGVPPSAVPEPPLTSPPSMPPPAVATAPASPAAPPAASSAEPEQSGPDPTLPTRQQEAGAGRPAPQRDVGLPFRPRDLSQPAKPSARVTGGEAGDVRGDARARQPKSLARITVSGGDPQQEALIRGCLKELQKVSGVPKPYVIELQRAGALHITSAPEAVRQTDLGLCLRTAFEEIQPPARVTVHVK